MVPVAAGSPAPGSGPDRRGLGLGRGRAPGHRRRSAAASPRAATGRAMRRQVDLVQTRRGLEPAVARRCSADRCRRGGLRAGARPAARRLWPESGGSVARPRPRASGSRPEPRLRRWPSAAARDARLPVTPARIRLGLAGGRLASAAASFGRRRRPRAVASPWLNRRPRR